MSTSASAGTVLFEERADEDARHVEAVEDVLELCIEHGVQVAVRALLELEHALRTPGTHTALATRAINNGMLYNATLHARLRSRTCTHVRVHFTCVLYFRSRNDMYGYIHTTCTG